MKHVSRNSIDLADILTISLLRFSCACKFIVGFKVGPPPFRKVGRVCLDERPLKVMEDAFYFILKALSIFNPYR